MPYASFEADPLPRSTPSGIAEEAYQARRGPRLRASGALPDPRARFRAMDGKLLHDLAKRAHYARLDAESGGEPAAQVARILSAEIDRRFPAADMVVLQRYGFACLHQTIIVDCRDYQSARLPMLLDQPRPLPNGAWRFTASGPGSAAVPRVPDEALAYFERLAVLRDERVALPIIDAWPSAFRKKEGRFPRWSEIEHQFPLFGEWMAAQRRAAA